MVNVVFFPWVRLLVDTRNEFTRPMKIRCVLIGQKDSGIQAQKLIHSFDPIYKIQEYKNTRIQEAY